MASPKGANGHAKSSKPQNGACDKKNESQPDTQLAAKPNETAKKTEHALAILASAPKPRPDQQVGEVFYSPLLWITAHRNDNTATRTQLVPSNSLSTEQEKKRRRYVFLALRPTV